MYPVITLVKASPADAETLLNLSRKTFFDAFSHQNDVVNMEIYAAKAFTLTKIKEELNNPDSAFYFAYLTDHIVGYLKMNTGDAQTEFKEDTALEIERIYVLQDHHGKNIGSQLIDFAIETATEKQFKYVWLGVW